MTQVNWVTAERVKAVRDHLTEWAKGAETFQQWTIISSK